MKKRILALILCLVMAVSLLPITAAAFDGYLVDYVCITGSGFERGADDAYVLKDDSCILQADGLDISRYANGSTVGLYLDAGLTEPVTEDPAGGGTFYLKYKLELALSGELSFTAMSNSNCVLVVDGYSTACIDFKVYSPKGGKDRCVDITFQVTKIHEHSWLFDHQGNSLTATCQNSGCTIGTVSVTLTAHSVTLPESPFNAKWETKGDFKEAFRNAQIYGPYYFYNFETEGFTEVDPNTFTPKAGEYQAQVYIYGLSGNEVAELRAFSTDDGIEQGGSFTSLWVDYTAADPAITAQTGDNRPIELMMAGVAVFSVLAAAAFALDSKRKYRQ